MDVDKLLRNFRAELETIKGAIACLEQLRDGNQSTCEGTKTRDSRGRKFMPAEERQEVSARMKRYWASRREQRRVG